MGRNSEEPCTMYWKREGDNHLLREAVCILPAIPEKWGKGKQDQYSEFFLEQKNSNRIIWYENDKAKRLRFFSFLTIKERSFLTIMLLSAQEENWCPSAPSVEPV